MGRRALRQIDPALDLSPWLIDLSGLTEPFSLDSIFATTGPLEIEIGSGKGLFLRSAAAGAADKRFLGIEIARKYARFAAAGLAKKKLTNAAVLHGDAMRFFTEFVAAESVHAVHVYFPDPWWKARHKKRRIINPRMAKAVERSLIVGGELHFWTDVQEYHETGCDIISQETSLRGPLPVIAQDPQHDLDYRTHFERRMRMHRQDVYRALFVKSESIAESGCGVAPTPPAAQ